MIRLNILSETKALEGYGAEHGLSFLVEADGKSFLFDTGASDLFMRNAALMGIDPNQAEAVVLSHGHFDHGDGLPYLERNTLVCHPGCFVKRYRKLGFGNIGISLSEASAGKRFDLVPSRDPLWLTEHLLFLGEIPRENAFEAQATPYILEDGTKDFIYDDSGLACVTEGGLVVVSGCAHSGICNMITHALRVTGEDRVKAVIG
jgi:7,8-dihydropterin-6-yl-methyl-4-(beta-D-ribofuranosyl)aminobenzene 5'-phosphate synthase